MIFKIFNNWYRMGTNHSERMPAVNKQYVWPYQCLLAERHAAFKY